MADPTFPTAETHWTRMLHYDLFGSRSDRIAPNREARLPRFGSPIAATAILLGIYVAMYVAVAALIRVLPVQDASASSFRRSTERAAIAAASTSAAHVDESSATDSPGRPSRRLGAGSRDR